MSSQALAAGHRLQEYRIDRLLGVGGFGLTYLATDSNLNLKVALKEYLPGDIAERGLDHDARLSRDVLASFSLTREDLGCESGHAGSQLLRVAQVPSPVRLAAPLCN